MSRSRPRTPDGVLIVIPTLNEAPHVATVIADLLADAPDNTRLVVVDGGSTDGTPAAVRRIGDPRIRILHNPDRIQSAGINRAVAAEGRDAAWLLRADAHARYPRGFLRSLLQDAATTGVAAVAVAMTTVAPQGFAAGVAAAQNSILGTGGAAHRNALGGRFVDHGHHALIRLDVFRAVGGYDATQSHNEDAEFDHRLTRHGGRIWLSGRTGIAYYPRPTPGALFRQYLHFGAGRAETLLKHAIRPRLRQTLPLLTAPAVALAAVALLALPFAGTAALPFMAPAVLWALLCLACGVEMALSRRRLTLLWAGPAAMLMHLAWSIGFLSRAALWPAQRKPAGGTLPSDLAPATVQGPQPRRGQ